MKEKLRKRGKLIFSKEVRGCNLEKMFFFYVLSITNNSDETRSLPKGKSIHGKMLFWCYLKKQIIFHLLCRFKQSNLFKLKKRLAKP